jgi:CCR4-NOT transcriptional complex subunit CAF120
MFEHSSLQEAYTGALIGGKGKALNNIAIIMDRSKTKHEDWVRVRFGAGTPWRRCWCVITPPDEREYQRLVKEMNKKKSAYDRSRPPVLKGDVKFYDTKKTKKAKPIAQISNAYSAFAIYPQSKPLIDASTLIKLEGIITIFSNPPTSMEGFVFVMPEVHPAVSGFEMMLRWLFPVWDTFNLYGRPGRLLADTVNPNSLMFAMPKERRYGYLEILDVSGLILTEGSQNWSEMEWRRNMKELTARRMEAIGNGSRAGSRYSRRSNRNSFGPSRSRVGFDDGASIRSNPSVSWGQGQPTDSPIKGAARTDSAPSGANTFQPPAHPVTPQHRRSASESHGLDRYPNQGPSGYNGNFESGPAPPPHSTGYAPLHQGSGRRYERDMIESPERVSSEDELAARSTPVRELQDLRDTRTPEPVAAPPAFAHAPGTLPPAKPYHSPELRREKSRMSNATLAQMAGASGMASGGGLAAGYAPGTEHPRTSEEQRRQNMVRYGEDTDQRGVLSNANTSGMNANPNGLTEGLVVGRTGRLSFEYQAPPPAPTPPTPNHQYLYANPNAQQKPQDYSNRSIAPQAMAPKAPPHVSPYETPAGYASSKTSHPPNTYAPNFSAAQRISLDEQRQGHAHTLSTDSTGSSRPRTSDSISRKPLPVQTSLPASSEGPPIVSASSSGSVGNMIDQAGFDQVVPRDHINARLAPEPQIHAQGSTASLYEDAASTASPDYASTRPSIDTKQSFERPRAGVMRTVGGNEDNYPGGSSATNQLSSNIPAFDFGPTINYAPKAPNKPSQPRKASPVRRQSPSNPAGQASRNMASPEPGHYRSESNTNRPDSRTVPWQPGMATLRSTSPSRQAITPEQFVQQRAATVTPLHAHQKQLPGNLLRSGTPTPPLGRSPKDDSFSHSRNSSGDMLQRPNSRGSSAALGVSGTGDYSTHLSAKEQEHVARITGSPLINMPSGDSRGAAPSSGLVGAIDAREREKRDMKQGLNSQAVQQAIAQRQQQYQAQQQAQLQYQAQQQYLTPAQQQAQQQYQQQAQAHPRAAQQAQYQGPQQYPQQYSGQRPNPQTPLASGGPAQNYTSQQQRPLQQRAQDAYMSPAASAYAQGGGWSSPQQRQEQQQQQYNRSPAAAVFAQGGGWSSPQQRPALTPEQQAEYVRQQQAQGSYVQPQQQGQGRGRGGQGYPGQGF